MRPFKLKKKNLVIIDHFQNISFISRRSVLLVEETGVVREKTDMPQVTNKLYHIMLY